MALKLTLGDFFPTHLFGDQSALTSLARSLGFGTTDKGLRQHEKFWVIAPKQKDVPEQFILISYKKEMLPFIVKNEMLNPETNEMETLFSSEERTALLACNGHIYDLQSKKIVCVANGYVPTLTVSSSVNEIPDSLTDEYGLVHTGFSNAKFKPAFEGTIIRLWKRDGYHGMSTHSSINIEKSFYGKSKPFSQLYKEYNGPTHDELFDPTKPNGNVVYFFIIINKDLLVVNQGSVGKGYIIFISFAELEDKDLSDTTTDWKISERFKFLESNDPFDYFRMSDDAKIDFASTPSFLDREVAIGYLKYGMMYKKKENFEKLPPLLQNGESLVAIIGTDAYHVNSESYNHRLAIYGAEPNTSFHACSIYDLCLKGTATVPLSSFNGIDKKIDTYSNYWELFPFICTPTIEQFDKLVSLPDDELLVGPLKNIKPVSEKDLNTADDRYDLRLRNALFCYYMSLPLHLKKEASQYYKKYLERVNFLYTYIFQNYDVMEDSFIKKRQNPDNSILFNEWPWRKNDTSTPGARNLYRVFTTVHSYTSNDKYRKIPFREKFIINLRDLLIREKGSTLYRMTTDIAIAAKQ